MVHRLLIDRHRRRTVRPFIPTGPLDDTPAPGAHSPEAAAARALERTRLAEALQRLPAPWLRIVVLHHIHGQPLDELARTEGIALGTCK